MSGGHWGLQLKTARGIKMKLPISQSPSTTKTIQSIPVLAEHRGSMTVWMTPVINQHKELRSPTSPTSLSYQCSKTFAERQLDSSTLCAPSIEAIHISVRTYHLLKLGILTLLDFKPEKQRLLLQEPP